MMKKVIVIGAGIAGLSAAIYAQRSGFDVTLCEQHSQAGGMCTGWKRKGYLFEGSTHSLTGSNPKTALYQLWRETGALDEDTKVFFRDPFYAIEWEGRVINLYRDLSKTLTQLRQLSLSPVDRKLLGRLESDVRSFSCLQMPVYDIKGVKSQNPRRMSISTLMKMLPVLPKLLRWSRITCKAYAEQFEHPAIRRLLRCLPDTRSATSLMAVLSSLDTGDGGYPEGGSLAMVDRMTKTFEKSGGKLLLRTRVKKVHIENGTVTGVILENGTPAEFTAKKTSEDTFLPADAVIITQETIAAVNQLFDIPLKDKWLKYLCENTKPAVCTFVCVGIRVELPQILTWEFAEPIHYADQSVSKIGFYNYSEYESYAPSGCTTLTTVLTGDTYDFWKQAKEEGRYEEEKRNLAGQVIRVICEQYPQAEGNIEVIEIATPLTYERYTGAYHGSWMSVVNVGDKMKIYPGFLKNIKGVYFAGHRLMTPGGLPVAIDSGRKAAQMVCRQFNVVFV